jgi:deoxyribose-phosphate aldolase
MFIDFAITDTEITDSGAKDLVKEALLYKIHSVTLPHYLIKSVKSIVSENFIDISCFIDYPLGISDLKTRLCALQQAFKANATCIDITMPQNLASNRKYDKIREDVKNCTEYCRENNLNIRYILEYRMFDQHCLKKICEILEQNGANYIFPSTGYFLDNLADNILASIFLYQNSKNINVLCTGNMWTQKHFETMKKSGLSGFRTNSINSLKNFTIFNSEDRQKNGV